VQTFEAMVERLGRIDTQRKEELQFAELKDIALISSTLTRNQSIGQATRFISTQLIEIIRKASFRQNANAADTKPMESKDELCMHVQYKS
jgi:hypothetical protein